MPKLEFNREELEQEDRPHRYNIALILHGGSQKQVDMLKAYGFEWVNLSNRNRETTYRFDPDGKTHFVVSAVTESMAEDTFKVLERKVSKVRIFDT